MKKRYNLKIILVALLLSSNLLMAQDANYDWSTSFGATANAQDYSHYIHVDDAGNVYTTGVFYGTIDFDPGAGVANLTATIFDVFVSKLDASGNFVWAKNFGGSSTNTAHSIYVDAAENVYLTGSFNGTIDFDPGTGTNNISTNGNYDIFVSKLDANGDFVWAKSFGSTAADEGHSISVDAGGNVYTTGGFRGTVDFNPGAGTNNLVSTNTTQPDIFVSKLDASGNFVWAKSFGGLGLDQGKSIHIDNAGNVYTTGQFVATVDFNPGAGTDNLVSNGVGDVFVSKLDANGDFVWAKGLGGASSELANSIDVDASGNVYTTGSFTATADFNPGAGTDNLISNGATDIFISKLDSNGDFVWAKGMGGTDNDLAFSLRIDGAGNAYSTGRFNGTVDFNPGAGTDNLISNGATDIFISKLDVNGDFVWAKSIGGTGSEEGKSIDVDGSGNIYATGSYYNTVDFDPGAGVSNLTSNGSADIFVVKLSCVIDVATTLNNNTISANAAGGTYQWIDCDNGNAIIPSATNQSFPATVNGNYAVIINTIGCMDTSACVSVTTVGINNINSENGLSIYPNPTKGLFEISLPDFSGTSVEVYSLVGQKIVDEKLTSNVTTIDLSNNESGIYLLKIRTLKGVNVQRVIKQ
ncbi:MAG: T9SS type A sorting domain-containing protein [Vicingaceae bacterium]|nr:T9SS type A sorting domain-containing protein [Vicingaceae bacterium]